MAPKSHRPDLVSQFSIPLDEYPKRCEEQIADWNAQAGTPPEVHRCHEFAADLVNAVLTDTPFVLDGNLPNQGQIPQPPPGVAVETP